MSLVGYARVSRGSQSVESQVLLLRKAGCRTIFKESASGGRGTRRPVLDSVLEHLTEGDTLVVWRLDRLGRSLGHLIATVQGLADRGVGFQSLHENMNTSSSTGRLVFHIFGALAEFERDLISDRTKAGLDAARERGAKPGRKALLSAEQKSAVRMARELGSTIPNLSAEYEVSRATIYRALA